MIAARRHQTIYIYNLIVIYNEEIFHVNGLTEQS
jgi:hypothetical protein